MVGLQGKGKAWVGFDMFLCGVVMTLWLGLGVYMSTASIPCMPSSVFVRDLLFSVFLVCLAGGCHADCVFFYYFKQRSTWYCYSLLSCGVG